MVCKSACHILIKNLIKPIDNILQWVYTIKSQRKSKSKNKENCQKKKYLNLNKLKKLQMLKKTIF